MRVRDVVPLCPCPRFAPALTHLVLFTHPVKKTRVREKESSAIMYKGSLSLWGVWWLLVLAAHTA